MAEQLSTRTVERLEKFCRNIRVSPEIDEEVHHELVTHMRDKLLGYLDGSEKLGEEDALLLVEHHFGNATRVQEMFRCVHNNAATGIGDSASSNAARETRIVAAILAGFQFVFWGLQLFQQRQWLNAYALIYVAFVSGAAAALAWSLHPAWRSRVMVARCLTLVGVGTVFLDPIAGAALHQSGGREFLAYMVAHPMDAWPLIPSIVLALLLSLDKGGNPASLMTST